LHIWIDADACPRGAKELVFRAADRLKINTTLVANQAMRFPKSRWIELVLVPDGLDEADNYIAEHVRPDDVVIAEDVPLAARVVDAGATCIDPRGLIYTEDNVKEKLASRNLMAELREAGMMGGGPAPYTPKDRSRFASSLDRVLTRLARSGDEPRELQS
jgi:hypothetical protein